jgi:hypothetical protein
MKLALLLAAATLAAAPAAVAAAGKPAAPAKPSAAAPTTPPQPTPAAAKKAEVALRAAIEQFSKDQPDYSTMTDELSTMIKPKAHQVTNLLAGMGPVSKVYLLGTDPDSGVIFFRVEFQNGAFEWAIKVNDDGKVAALALRPAQG